MNESIELASKYMEEYGTGDYSEIPYEIVSGEFVPNETPCGRFDPKKRRITIFDDSASTVSHEIMHAADNDVHPKWFIRKKDDWARKEAFSAAIAACDVYRKNGRSPHGMGNQSAVDFLAFYILDPTEVRAMAFSAVHSGELPKYLLDAKVIYNEHREHLWYAVLRMALMTPDVIERRCKALFRFMENPVKGPAERLFEEMENDRLFLNFGI